MRVLVTRPEPAASRTAARLRALGHAVVVAPLLVPRAVPWSVPPGGWQAVAFTSASGPDLSGNVLRSLIHLPAYTVGEATAAAAREAGFIDVRPARGDASAVFRLAAGDGIASLLHLAGRDRSDAVVPPGLTVGLATVYAADLAPGLPAFEGELVLLYSARTAAHFADLFTGDRADVEIVALSRSVAAAAGTGWRNIALAAEPTEDALFAAARLTCESPV